MHSPHTSEWFLAHAVQSGADPGMGPNSSVDCLCWACSSPIKVRMQIGSDGCTHGVVAPSQCWHCGALTHPGEATEPHHAPKDSSLFKTIIRVLSSFRGGVVAAVSLVVLLVITLGSVVILPVTCPSPLVWLFNQAITWTFASFVFFFYASSIYSSTSTVRACYPDYSKPKTQVPSLFFRGWTYCTFCQYFKPPQASHCRVCNMCVVNKDHHCVFVNNCVGRGNMRSFLLFLIFTVVSITFCGFHMALSLFIERSTLITGLLKAWASCKGPRILLLYLFVFKYLKWTCLVAIGNLFFSFAILGGVGMLLWFQLVSLASLPPLKPPDAKEGGDEKGMGDATKGVRVWSNVMSQLSLIIRGEEGQKSIIMWIWPIWSPNHFEGSDRNSTMVRPRATWCSPGDDLDLNGLVTGANIKLE